VTPRQALAECWRGTHWPLRMTAGEVADRFLGALSSAGFAVVSRDRAQGGAEQISNPAGADVTVAPVHLSRCWSCGWEQTYVRPADARAQGRKHRCRAR
jgi:hypothetical protein